MKDLIEMGVCCLNEVSFVVSQLCLFLLFLLSMKCGVHGIYILSSHKYAVF
jgi:hypothetical protein